ncbi:MAG: S41 family peptidase [Muribaculaceae bacterium]|nr:S41 family peptidase [Muribaculaceae bacterium]
MKKILIVIASCIAIVTMVAKNTTTRSSKADISRNLQIFNALYKELQTQYVDTIDADATMQTAIRAMLSTIDPYTEYFPADNQDEILSISSGQYAGIGSVIMKRDKDVIIHRPSWGTPSRKAGVRHGDVILAVDDWKLTPDVNVSEVSKRLKGQPGTHVKVDVRRPYAEDSLLTFDIVRGEIKVDPLPWYGMVGDSIGYIRLSTFNEKSAEAVRNALLSLKANPGLRGIILDLRDNGGGLLESAVQIVGNFVDKGTEVVRTKFNDSTKVKIYKTPKKPIDTKTPLAVLINEGTASSAEIVSGALQDLDRAVVIGQRSYGKGLVQHTRPLPYDGLFKVTVARYYIPSGRLIQAIDYSHRDENGRVARIPDSLTNVFHTLHGREVRDGGGITPDLKIDVPEVNRLLFNIVNDFWAFDFANRYAARHDSAEIGSATTLVIGDSIFEEFKSFVDPAKFKYDRMCESGIKYLREAAESEGYMNDSVKAQFERLEGMLKHDLNHDLNHNRASILEILDTEIADRYFSDAELTRRMVSKGDPEVDSAKAVLSDESRYKQILKRK